MGTPPQIGDQSWPILQFLFTTQHLQSTIGLNEVEMKLLVCTNTKPKQNHIMIFPCWFYQDFNCNPGYLAPAGQTKFAPNSPISLQPGSHRGNSNKFLQNYFPRPTAAVLLPYFCFTSNNSYSHSLKRCNFRYCADHLFLYISLKLN